MKHIYLLLFLLSVTTLLHAQKSTYLNLSTGPKYDYWEYEGDIDELVTKPSFSLPFLRLSLERELAANFRASIGVDINGHSFTPIFKNVETFSNGINTAFFGLHIPVRAHYQFFEIDKELIKIRLIGHAGYQLGINLDYQSASFSSGSFPGDQSVSETFRNDKRALFHLGEIGGRLEIEVFNDWALLLGGHFAEGFNEVLEGNIIYDIGDGISHGANIFTQGSYHIFEIGAQYRLNKR